MTWPVPALHLRSFGKKETVYALQLILHLNYDNSVDYTRICIPIFNAWTPTFSSSVLTQEVKCMLHTVLFYTLPRRTSCLFSVLFNEKDLHTCPYDNTNIF